MELASNPTDSAGGPAQHDTNAEMGDVEMDDMDLDLTIEPDMAAYEEEAPAVASTQPPYPTITTTTDTTLTHSTSADAMQPPSEEARQPAPMKIYIHGLDDFTTEDVRSFSTEHFPTGDFEKVEWIDDSSAKIVYGSVSDVAAALDALIQHDNPDPRPSPFGDTYVAKRASARPGAELRVRAAALGDVKKKRAHEGSRFYLMNPEHDPRERRRTYDSRRGRNGHDTATAAGDYRRRRFDDREQRRREEGEGEGGAFDVSMYDDDAGEAASVRPRSASESGSFERRRRPRRRSDEDLFGTRAGNRVGPRLRDRSASPLGDGDGRLGFYEEQPVRRTARQRSTTPPHLRREIDREYSGRSNAGKELFPDGSGTNGGGKELFPMKSPRELFPNRSSVSVHRRTPAFDAADETPQKQRSLADRITGGPNNGSSSNSKSNSRQDVDDDVGFRGAASSQSTGFSIRGAAASDGGAAVVKELFPLKTGTNAGKELFGEKIKGRGGARRRAEDMF